MLPVVQFDQLRHQLGKYAPPASTSYMQTFIKFWTKGKSMKIILDESKGLLTLVCVMGINLCWSCWSPRLWSDFSFWQVLEKSLCVPPHSKQQPVWEKEAAKNKQILRTKTFMRVHCLEISQEEREVVSHGSFLTLEDHFNKPFESCKKWLII